MLGGGGGGQTQGNVQYSDIIKYRCLDHVRAVASHPKDSVEDVHGVPCVFHLGHEVVQPDKGAGTTNASTTTSKEIGLIFFV